MSADQTALLTNQLNQSLPTEIVPESLPADIVPEHSQNCQEVETLSESSADPLNPVSGLAASLVQEAIQSAVQAVAQGHIQIQQETSGISNNLEHVQESTNVNRGEEPVADSIVTDQNIDCIPGPSSGLPQNIDCVPGPSGGSTQNLANPPDNGAVDEQIIQALIESQTQQEERGAQGQGVIVSADMPPPVAVKPSGQYRPAVQVGGSGQQVVHTVRTQQTTVRQTGIPVGAKGPPGAVQVLPPGIVQAGTVKVQQSTVQVRQPSVQVQQQTVQVRQPAVQVMQPGVQVMQPGVQVRQPGVQVQKPAVQVQPVVIRAQQPGGAQIRPQGTQVQQSQVHVQQSQSVVRQSVVSHGGQQVQGQPQGQQVQTSQVKVVQINQAGGQREQPEIKVGEAVVFQLGGQQGAEGAKPVAVSTPQPAVQVAQPTVQVAQPEVQVAQPQVQVAQPPVQAAQPPVQATQTQVQVAQPQVQPAIIQPTPVEPVHTQPVQAPVPDAHGEAPSEISEDIIEPQQAPPRAQAPPPASSPAVIDPTLDSPEVSPSPQPSIQPSLEQQIESVRAVSPEAVQEETIIPSSRQQAQQSQSTPVIKQVPSGEQEKVISTRRPLTAPLDRLQKSCKSLDMLYYNIYFISTKFFRF